MKLSRVQLSSFNYVIVYLDIMKGGVIGLISGEVREPQSIYRTSERDGVQYSRSLQIDLRGHTESGEPVYVGEAAIEVTKERESISIGEDGEIAVIQEPVRDSKYTEVILLPKRFAVVSSGAGEFAFDLIRETEPNTDISRASLDLNSYAEEYYSAPDVNPWQVGFYGNIGSAEKGVVYGDEVFNDDEIGDVLDRSQINQLGLDYDVNGDAVKVTMADSGYVEIYQPSNYDEVDFAEYVQNELLEYGSVSVE